jgi:hypothetical protein
MGEGAARRLKPGALALCTWFPYTHQIGFCLVWRAGATHRQGPKDVNRHRSVTEPAAHIFGLPSSKRRLASGPQIESEGADVMRNVGPKGCGGLPARYLSAAQRQTKSDATHPIQAALIWWSPNRQPSLNSQLHVWIFARAARKDVAGVPREQPGAAHTASGRGHPSRKNLFRLQHCKRIRRATAM